MSSTFNAGKEDNARSNFPVSAIGKEALFHILVADDLEQNRLIAVTILENMGYRLEVAKNGKEAVNKWEHGSFDLILMDIHMPLIDGVEATWIIRDREKDRGDYTPILAFSADVSKEDSEVFSSLGFDGFVRKPFDLETLIQEVNCCIQLRRRKPA